VIALGRCANIGPALCWGVKLARDGSKRGSAATVVAGSPPLLRRAPASPAQVGTASCRRHAVVWSLLSYMVPCIVSVKPREGT
jgi:hypothetical protein